MLGLAAVVEQIDWMTMSGWLRVITANFFVEEMAHDGDPEMPLSVSEE